MRPRAGPGAPDRRGPRVPARHAPACVATMGQPVATRGRGYTDPREGHAEQVRACILHACPHTVRRVSHPQRREPRHGHAPRHGRRGRGRAGLLPPGRVLLGHHRHHALRLLGPGRRQHGTPAGPLQPLGRLPRLHPGPGRRRRDLRRLRPLVRGQRRRQRHVRRLDLLPGQRPGGVVHEGARRVDRAARGRQRARRARRTAGDLAGRGRLRGPAQVRRAGHPVAAADRFVDRRRGEPRHAGPAGRHRPPRVRRGGRGGGAAGRGPGSGAAE